jgi:mono/diheme cytochrome c family protein
MGRFTDARRRQRLHGFLAGSLGLSSAVALALLMSSADAKAGWPWSRKHVVAPCGHPGCHRDRCLAPEGWGGNWYWVRDPDQEQRVVMSLYNRYCIRCHGIDGRGVWDIPDVPDFSDTRWQSSRSDHQIINIIMDGRGACMPTFRGTLAIDEAAGMARYLRTLVPGTETTRPDVRRWREQPAKPATTPPAGASIPPPRQVQ